MTKERREDLVLAAIVVSVALHIGLMFYARTRVMVNVSPAGEEKRRREAMRVEDYVPLDPERFETIRDIMASKEAPEAETDDLSAPADAELPDDPSKHWDGDIPVPQAPGAESVQRLADEPARFEIDPVKFQGGETSVPEPAFDVYVPQGTVLTAAPAGDSFGPVAPESFGIVPVQAMPAPVFSAAEETIAPIDSSPENQEFTPSDEVYEEVDEKIVEAEKEAVRDLVESIDAKELDEFVSVASTAAEEGGWTYFNVMVSPRLSLEVVPKDVVVLIDASGSIGSDRLANCRKAVKSILRTAFNSGDRFNLVAFRNRFSYAFKNWRECDAESFSRADKWLANLTAHGRTEVFETISSVLTLPRDPARPLIALVVTDGDANEGVTSTAEILSKFTSLNDGLISVYMYGVKAGANRELIDVLTRGNRGESFIFDGSRWNAGSKIEALSERFRDPVMSDLRIVFAAGSRAEAYPRLLKNLYRGDVVEIIGRVPQGTESVSFSLRGLNGKNPYEGFFTVDLSSSARDGTIAGRWATESEIDRKLR